MADRQADTQVTSAEPVGRGCAVSAHSFASQSISISPHLADWGCFTTSEMDRIQHDLTSPTEPARHALLWLHSQEWRSLHSTTAWAVRHHRGSVPRSRGLDLFYACLTQAFVPCRLAFVFFLHP